MDRFILNRNELDVDTANFWLKHRSIRESLLAYFSHTSLVKQSLNHHKKLSYTNELSRTLNVNNYPRILPFTSSTISEDVVNQPADWPVHPRTRPVSRPQIAVLDLPNIRNDVCCNVLHWSSSNHIVAALGKIIYLWHVPTCSMSSSIKSQHNIISLRMNVTSSTIAFSCKDPNGCIIKVWDLKRKVKLIQKRQPLRCDHYCYITCIEYHPSNKFIILGCKRGNLSVKTADLQQTVSSVQSAHGFLEIIRIRCSMDGRFVASSGFDGYVRVWHFPHMELLYSLYESFCSRGLSWHPWRTNYLCVGTTNGSLSLINTSLAERIKKITDKNTIIYDINFNKVSGELVASQTFCHRLYDTSTYTSQVNVLASLTRVVDRFEGHCRRVLFLEWSPDNETLASAGSDETIHLWKFFDKKPKIPWKKNVTNTVLNLNDFIR